jgi:hypothetical protein
LVRRLTNAHVPTEESLSGGLPFETLTVVRFPDYLFRAPRKACAISLSTDHMRLRRRRHRAPDRNRDGEPKSHRIIKSVRWLQNHTCTDHNPACGRADHGAVPTIVHPPKGWNDTQQDRYSHRKRAKVLQSRDSRETANPCSIGHGRTHKDRLRRLAAFNTGGSATRKSTRAESLPRQSTTGTLP